jgi:transposase
MATTYSDDLRRKLLEAYERNEGSLAELADRFSVSQGWAKKISAQRTRTGKRERQPGRLRGLASKITPELRQQLAEWIEAQSNLALAELQLRLWENCQVEVSVSRLWTVLQEMGMRLKKSQFTPPSKTPKPGASAGRLGGSRRVSWRRRT